MVKERKYLVCGLTNNPFSPFYYYFSILKPVCFSPSGKNDLEHERLKYYRKSFNVCGK